MDPLSLAANVLAIIGAANATARRLENLRSFRGAPDQLLQVINEVSDIRTIFTTVQQACTALDEDHDIFLCDKLRELLFNAKRNFGFFDELAQRLLPDAKHLSTARSKVSWRLWLREQKNIQNHLVVLRDSNQKIMNVLTILHVSNIPKVRVCMADIISRQNETGRIARSVQGNLEELEMVTSQALDIRPRLSALQQSLQVASTNSELRRRSSMPSLQDLGPAIRVPTSVLRPQVCNKFCMCRCHKRKTLTSPSWAQYIIGALFIGYTAIPILTPTTCNENMCVQRQDQALITVNYYFPSWLLRRAILLRSCWSPRDSCMISVKTPRIVSHSATQILLSIQGNVTEMQRLFSQGLASPFDVDVIGGVSFLSYAIFGEHVEMCKFLLSEHADPYYLDNSFSYIWRKQIETKELSPTMVIIKDLFNNFLEDYDALAKELNLTFLHQIVLGMVDIDLRTHLSITTSNINTCCSNGRTPLMWAAIRSDLEAIQTLIDFGASFDTVGYDNWNVFHTTARYGSIETLKLLLDNATAMLKSPNIYPHNLEPLLFDRPDVAGYTPLIYALHQRKESHALLLLEYQCTINPLFPIESPLLHAVEYNMHKVLKYLLMKGVKTDVVDTDRMGALHIAGLRGDLETIFILLHHEPPLSTSTINVDIYGNTPMRAFENERQRWIQEDPEESAKRREAFEALLNKINSHQLQL